MTMETERLVLRRWRESDATALCKVASDPDVGPEAGWVPHASIEDSRSVIRAVLMHDPECYAIVIKGREPADEPVGSIGLRVGGAAHIDIPRDECEIGYWIGNAFQGRGYVPEAVEAVMSHAFVDLHAKAVWASHYKDNRRSRRVLEKVGMLPHHVEEDRFRPEFDDRRTCEVLRLTQEEWETAQHMDPRDAETIARQQAEARDIMEQSRRIAFVRSGGQTGADRGALDAARANDVPIRGWCPPGGLAEDAPEAPGVRAAYPELREGTTKGYVERTEWNVRDSHATLIVAPDGLEPRSGTEMTKRFADHLGRPCLVIAGPDETERAWKWLQGLSRELDLNVAGPRESKCPGTYLATYDVVDALLALSRKERTDSQRAW